MRKLIYIGLIPAWLMSHQSHAWDYACVHLVTGAWFTAQVHVKTAAGSYDQEGPSASVWFSSCVNIHTIRPGTVLNILANDGTSEAQCAGAPILQDTSHGTVTYDTWGALSSIQCSGPEGLSLKTSQKEE